MVSKFLINYAVLLVVFPVSAFTTELRCFLFTTSVFKIFFYIVLIFYKNAKINFYRTLSI